MEKQEMEMETKILLTHPHCCKLLRSIKDRMYSLSYMYFARVAFEVPFLEFLEAKATCIFSTSVATMFSVCLLV